MITDRPGPLKIVVSPPPPSPNRSLRQGFSIGQQTGVRARILKEVRYQMKGEFVAWGIAHPEAIITIHCHLIRKGSKPWDEGNIGSGGSLKWVVDALVKVGAIQEDSPSFVAYTTPTQSYKPRSAPPNFPGRLIVTLEWREE